jgi:hypothetical protein
MAEVPQLAGLYKKYVEQGFHIVGLECQGSAADAISKVAASKGAGYQMTTGGNLKGANVSGIPHGFLFGPDGKMVEDNPHGAALEKKVKELLKETSAYMAGPGPYVKLAGMAAQIKTGVGLGSALKTLATKKDSKDAAEAAEAKMMYESLNGAAQEMLSGAIAMKESKPVDALAKLDKLALQFSGDEVGTKAKTEADALKKDPKVKKEVEAEAVWKQIATMNEGLKPVRGVKDPKDPAFMKLNGPAIQAMIGGCQSLTQRYAGTEAASKAEGLMNDYR